jgi:hypothetical protein
MPARRACRWCRTSLAADEANRSGSMALRNNSSCVVTMFSMAELSLASCRAVLTKAVAAGGSTAAAVAAHAWKCRCAVQINHRVYRNHQSSKRTVSDPIGAQPPAPLLNDPRTCRHRSTRRHGCQIQALQAVEGPSWSLPGAIELPMLALGGFNK